MSTGELDFSEDEQKIIKQSIDSIRKVMNGKNRDLKSIVSVVTSTDVGKTKDAIEVRFKEESVLNVQMNMIAFD